MLLAVSPKLPTRSSAWPGSSAGGSDSATRHSRRSFRLTRKSLIARPMLSWLAALVQPALEQRTEVLPGDPVGEGDELVDVGAAVAVPGRPAAQDLQHLRRADLQPQRLQRHPAAHVGRGGEEVLGGAGVAGG